jgi:mannose/fructose/N-acetylgalactosamine-specific phosphotransferase system component IID
VKIPIRVALAILWRSLFIQAAWNFKGMQNIGFTHAILPGLKYLIPERLPEAIKHYISFFNTQPYMAPTAIGVFLHLHKQGNEELVEKISPSLTGSLAAIGDTFFWATLKPILALALLISAITDQLWGLFIALVLYDSVHIWIMARGFYQGYRYGSQGALALGHILSIDFSMHISLLIPFLSGVVLCLAPKWIGDGHAHIAGLFIFVISIFLIKLRVNIFWLVYGVFTLSMLWTMLR